VVPTADRHGESNPEPCRPLGRQGDPVSGCFRTRNLEEEPSAEAARGGEMVKGEGMRGLRAKARGEGGRYHWGHALTRAHARVCPADGRTDSTICLQLRRGQDGGEWQWAGLRGEAVRSQHHSDGSRGRQG